jgi:hypothetical protein
MPLEIYSSTKFFFIFRDRISQRKFTNIDKFVCDNYTRVAQITAVDDSVSQVSQSDRVFISRRNRSFTS